MEEAAYASACAGEQALAWGRGCGAAVQLCQLCRAPAPLLSPRCLSDCTQGGCESRLLRFLAGLLLLKMINVDVNTMIHQGVFKGFVKGANVITSALPSEELSPAAVQRLSCGHTGRSWLGWQINLVL